jgi:hypothetical protein
MANGFGTFGGSRGPRQPGGMRDDAGTPQFRGGPGSDALQQKMAGARTAPMARARPSSPPIAGGGGAFSAAKGPPPIAGGGGAFSAAKGPPPPGAGLRPPPTGAPMPPRPPIGQAMAGLGGGAGMKGPPPPAGMNFARPTPMSGGAFGMRSAPAGGMTKAPISTGQASPFAGAQAFRQQFGRGGNR